MSAAAEFAANAGMVAIGVVFALAFVGKVRDPRGFVATVDAYHVLPHGLAAPFGAVVLVTEALITVTLVPRVLVPIGLALALGLVTAFSIAVAVNLYRGRRIACGCFGQSDEPISNTTLVRLGVLLVLASSISIEQLTTVRMEWPIGPTIGMLASGCLLVAIGNWILSAQELRRILIDGYREDGVLSRGR